MAQVVINVDTDNKTVAVSVDGKEIPNVANVNASTDDVYGYFSFECCQYEKDGDLRKYTRLMANETEAAKAALEDGSGTKAENGLVSAPDVSPMQKSMAELLRKRK